MAKKKPTTKAAPDSLPATFSTGCALTDCVVGGGWRRGRIINVVGDSSLGKTQFMIEACANFAHTYPKGLIRYNETERAFDKEYAQVVGLPVERVEVVDTENFTIEDVYKDLLAQHKLAGQRPLLYIIDSLDALTTEAEVKNVRTKGLGKGQFNDKAKEVSKFLRMTAAIQSGGLLTIMIVSQEKDKVGAMVGNTKTRSGGRALQYYSSQVLWLSKGAVGEGNRKVHEIRVKIRGMTRTIGIWVKAKSTKNKVGSPMRFCEFPILFNYGIDDATAHVVWLQQVNEHDVLERLGLGDKPLDRLGKMDDQEFAEARRKLASIVPRVWDKIERECQPVRRKYQ